MRVEKFKSNRKESMIMNGMTLNDINPAEARTIANGGLSGVATVVNASSVGRMGNVRRSLQQPEEKKL